MLLVIGIAQPPLRFQLMLCHTSVSRRCCESVKPVQVLRKPMPGSTDRTGDLMMLPSMPSRRAAPCGSQALEGGNPSRLKSFVTSSTVISNSGMKDQVDNCGQALCSRYYVT